LLKHLFVVGAGDGAPAGPKVLIFAGMKAIRGVTELLAAGRREEEEGQPEEAATLYEEVMDQDPRNSEAVRRLLVIYRRLKNYTKELTVIDRALDAFAQGGKAAQDRWIAAHPGAARLGKAVLRSLGGAQVTGYGTNPAVEQLMKRRSVVEKKLGGKVTPKRKAERRVKADRVDKKKLKLERKERAVQAKREVAEGKRREVEARKAAVEAAKAAKEAEKSSKRAEAEKNAKPSLFVISLRYLVSLEKIDTAMQKHVAFLDKFFDAGVFLVAGRQVPRTGGVIIARAKDRAAVERIMKVDPFIKDKLARADIVEFKASRTSKKRPDF
jgi:uncharacterized protein YciI